MLEGRVPRLTKGMYPDHGPVGLFGLRGGQCRTQDFVHNGGWYNTAGQKLGWGDLSPDDIPRITSQLRDDEIFVVLSEENSFWKFVTKVGLLGSMAETKPDVNEPGADYVADNAMFVITPRRFFRVDEYGTFTRDEDTTRTDHSGLLITFVTKSRAREIIAGAVTV